MKAILFILSITFIISCSSAPERAAKFDTAGYDIENIGSGIDLATKLSPEGFVSEMGYILDGNKTGQWLKYNKDGKIIESTNYLNGKKYGKHIKYKGSTGYIELLSTYKNDILHGVSEKYTSRKVSEKFNYKNGELDGVYTQYFRGGNKQKEVEFKKGVQDGTMRFYDEEGNLTMEYIYKNGEKVRGGIVE